MKILLSPPKYFDVMYSINPWMNPDQPIGKKEAREQWDYLKKRLEQEGVDVKLAEMPSPDLPDFVFTANAGMVMGNRAIVSRFRDKERQPESEYFYKWFVENGYETLMLEDDEVWEGEACMFPIAGHVLCSHGIRADKKAYRKITDFFRIPKEKVVYAGIIDPYFYHLDVCFCPLNENTAMYCEMAFDGETRAWLKQNVKNLISVSYDEALNFACNAIIVNKTVFLNKGASIELIEALHQAGYFPVEIPIHQFIRAGGGVKCLALYLDRWDNPTSD